MSKEIIEITWNWYIKKCGDIQDVIFNKARIGHAYNKKGKCINIEEHRAMGEGDKWYYDITYELGNMERVFNPNTVVFV